MNCNEAFDRMTMPGAAADASLERHLSRCPRCRAMQETLSPAIDWLLPADEESRGELRRPAFLSEEAVQIAERAARGLTRPAISVQIRRPLRRLVARWIAWSAIAGLICCAVFIPQATGPQGSAHAVAPAEESDGCLWQMPAARTDPALPTAQQVVASCVACHVTLPQ